jgi:hypothetical protein
MDTYSHQSMARHDPSTNTTYVVLSHEALSEKQVTRAIADPKLPRTRSRYVHPTLRTPWIRVEIEVPLGYVLKPVEERSVRMPTAER